MSVKFTNTNLPGIPQPKVVKQNAETKTETETKGAAAIDGGVATPNNTVVTRADAPGTPPAPTSTPNVELPDSLPVVPTPTFGAKSTPVTATGVAPDALMDIRIEISKKISETKRYFKTSFDELDSKMFEFIKTEMWRKLESLETKMTELNTKLTDVNNLVKSYNSEEPKSEETHTKYLEALGEYNSCLQSVNEEYESLQKLINGLPLSVIKLTKVKDINLDRLFKYAE